MLAVRTVELIGNRWFMYPVIQSSPPEPIGADIVLDYLSEGEIKFEIDITSFPSNDGCGLSFNALGDDELEGGYYSLRISEFKPSELMLVKITDSLMYILNQRIASYLYIKKRKKVNV